MNMVQGDRTQLEFIKSATSIKAEANKNNSEVKLMSGKKDIAIGTYDNTLQSRKHEEDIKNIMTRQSIPRGQPRFR